MKKSGQVFQESRVLLGQVFTSNRRPTQRQYHGQKFEAVGIRIHSSTSGVRTGGGWDFRVRGRSFPGGWWLVRGGDSGFRLVTIGVAAAVSDDVVEEGILNRLFPRREDSSRLPPDGPENMRTDLEIGGMMGNEVEALHGSDV